MHRERNCVGQQTLTIPNVILLHSTLIIFRITLYVEKQLAMDIIHHVHSTLVPLLDLAPLMIHTSVDCPSPTGSKASVSTSGAMLQGIVNLVPTHVTVHVQLTQVEQSRHLLTLTFTVSLALTEHHPDSGTPPTHSGMAKAATVVASAAIPVVHRGSSRPCL